MWPWGWIAVGWVALIFVGGAGLFGRDGTQRLIDQLRRAPRVHALLNRWHGEIRASVHYIEFGPLSLILYLLLHRRWGDERWTWWAALATLVIGSALAYLDEKRQEMTPGRQFRTIDFKHSLKAVFGMQAIIALVALARWLAATL